MTKHQENREIAFMLIGAAIATAASSLAWAVFGGGGMFAYVYVAGAVASLGATIFWMPGKRP